MIRVSNTWRHPNDTLPGGRVLQPGASVELSFAEALDCLSPVSLLRCEWPSEMVRGDDGRLSISYIGEFGAFSGFGLTDIGILLGLHAAGVHVSVHGADPAERHKLAQAYPEAAAIVFREDTRQTKWGLANGAALNLDLLPTKRRLLRTMWEMSHYPATVVTRYLDRADYLLVPSEQQRQLAIDSGIRSSLPTAVVPDPLDLDAYAVADRDPDAEPFRFISWAFQQPRKGILLVVAAFQHAFGNNPAVELVVKTRGGALGMSRNYGCIDFGPNISVYDQNWPLPRLVQEVQNANAGVWGNFGEGVGDPPLMCLATGAPVVTPNYSGCADYSDIPGVYPYGHRRMTTCPGSVALGGKKAEWWEPDMRQMAERMVYVKENYKATLAQAKLGAVEVRQRYSREAATAALLKVLETLD